MNLSQLPHDVQMHLPSGYEASQGVWLVLPAEHGHSISEVNDWIRLEDWYPASLQSIIWFGDDGIGNFIGWDPAAGYAILWNSEDGEEPWRIGTVAALWNFITNGYVEAPEPQG
jgi:hypothetical protein